MIEITCTEQDIENFLCSENNLEHHLGLRFLKRQVRTPVGIVDIIAYNKNTKKFVIIELKKDTLDYKAYFQLHRYANFFKKYTSTYHRDRRDFDLLLIGRHLHEDLHYSTEIWHPEGGHSYADTWYTLFGYNFTTALSFDYENTSQAEIESTYYARLSIEMV